MSNSMMKIEGLQDLESWGVFAQKAGLIPQGTTPYQAMAIIQAGKEMGLQPLQALRSMSFIRGRLTMSVQAQLALAREKCNITVQKIEEQNGTCKATLMRGEEEITCSYTLDDAKKAGLIKPDGAYDKYPRQMLRWRAIGDALRLIAPDMVLNLLSPEEVEAITDITTEQEASEKAQAKAKELKEELVKAKEKLPAEPEMQEEPCVSEAQTKRFWAICKASKIPDDTVKRYLKNFYNIESTKEIKVSWYDDICDWAKRQKGQE